MLIIEADQYCSPKNVRGRETKEKRLGAKVGFKPRMEDTMRQA